jgi:hypothetical protein
MPGQEEGGIVALGVGKPEPGPHPLVEGKRVVIVSLCVVELTHPRGEQAEVAGDGTGADLIGVDVELLELDEPLVEGGRLLGGADRGIELGEKRSCQEPVVVDLQHSELVAGELLVSDSCLSFPAHVVLCERSCAAEQRPLGIDITHVLEVGQNLRYSTVLTTKDEALEVVVVGRVVALGPVAELPGALDGSLSVCESPLE